MKKIIIILILLTICGCTKQKEEIINYIEMDKTIYIALNGEKILPQNITTENEELTLNYESEDTKILTINNNKLKANQEGETKLKIRTSNNKGYKVNIIVSSLITEAKINNEKPYIECSEYTEEETEILEEILESRINEGGKQTRAGALNAARFLLLEFKNSLNYFNENGRLENHSNILHIDGEGRYYHKGLYISQSKYKDITASTSSGPKMWGCPLKSMHYNKYMDNGLNCSGFITWALYNAGYDIKDVGAGDFDYIKNELLDLRPKEKITEELLKSSKIKSGDLIGFDGHIAMIIGLEDDILYIGESYETGTRVRTFTHDELINSDFTDIILMDDYYKSDGNYTSMW